MLKLKKDDNVKILRGKDSGKTGKVVSIQDGKALLEGINTYKKHIKSAMTKDGKGGIYDLSRPLALSSLALVCPKCGKVTRVGFRVDKDAKRRFCKKCGVALE